MKTFTFSIDADAAIPAEAAALDSAETLVVAFGARELADRPELFARLAAAFPRARVMGCSTAGEICGATVSDQTLAVAVTRFERTQLRSASARVSSAADSARAGAQLARLLAGPGLRAVFVLSDGVHVNGSELVRGLNAELPDEVVITGGLAGDGDRFQTTWVLEGGQPALQLVTAVGFYGDALVIGHGSRGGWQPFGMRRPVTRSTGNVLHELGGRPALEVYKQYLGELAKGLPATALLFPLALRRQASDQDILVRTILSIDEATQSMTFAGDIPEGADVQLMRTSLEDLIEGAAAAARQTADGAGSGGASLSLVVSCVGRRLVLGQRTEEEVESALESLPQGTSLVGFYSYGEISPLEASGASDLHNQTMTLTTFSEAAA